MERSQECTKRLKHVKTVQVCVQSVRYNKRKKPQNHFLSDYILSQTFFSKPLVSVSVEVLLQAIVGGLHGASLILVCTFSLTLVQL